MATERTLDDIANEYTVGDIVGDVQRTVVPDNVSKVTVVRTSPTSFTRDSGTFIVSERMVIVICFIIITALLLYGVCYTDITKESLKIYLASVIVILLLVLVLIVMRK